MNFRRVSFLDLLAWDNKAQFAVPDWRRTYEWSTPTKGSQEVEQLWQDIRAHCDIEKKHFFGPILLRQLPKQSGKPGWELVDGQQRLVTLLLLLIALRDICEERGTDCSELTGYLTTNESDEGRLILQTGSTDDQRVMKALLLQTSSKLDEKPRRENRIYLVYHYLLSQLERDLGQGTQKFLLSILLGVEFLVLTLGADDDTKRIFEFVMSQDKQIKPEDLIARLTDKFKKTSEPVNQKKSTPPPNSNQRQPRSLLILSMTLVLASILCLGVIFWWRNHASPGTKTTYYQELTSRLSVPEGITPLSGEEAKHRGSSFHIESKEGKVQRVTEVNGSGAPVDDANLHNASTEEIHYRKDGELDYILYFNHAGKQVFQETYHDLSTDNAGVKHREVDFKVSGKNAPSPIILNLSLQRYDVRGDEKATIAKSNITGEVLDYASDGQIERVHYRNGAIDSRTNVTGVWGQQFERNSAGQETKASSFGPDGTPFPDMLGVISWTRTIDASGFPVEEDYTGIDGQLTLNQTGFAKAVFKFDEHGNKTEIAYFNIKDEPAFNRQRVAQVTAKYDDHGNIIEQSYFGIDGKPVFNREGSARLSAKYDRRGNVIEMNCLDFEGNPILDKEGTAKLTAIYDEHGNVIEQNSFGIDGKPALNKAGVSRVTFKYDKQGNIIEQANFGIDGKPVLNQDGYARETFQYDDRGNVTEQVWLGLDGMPISALAGAAKLKITYDDRDNITSMAYFNINNHLVLNKEGFAKVTYGYDDRGYKTEEDYFNEDDEPSLNKAGVARKTLKLDDRGNVIEQMNYGTDGKPTADQSGTVKLAAKYDDHGNLIEETCLGDDGRMIPDKAGIARETLKYDIHSRLIELSCFGADNQPVRDRDGVAIAVFKYDDQGNKIESAYSGTDGRPTLNSEGIAKETLKYDARGNMIEGDFYGTDGQLTLSKHGFAKETLKYDAHDRIIEVTCFGFDGQPIQIGGISRIVYTYDNSGKLIKAERFDNNGQLVQ